MSEAFLPLCRLTSFSFPVLLGFSEAFFAECGKKSYISHLKLCDPRLTLNNQSTSTIFNLVPKVLSIPLSRKDPGGS